MRVLLSEYLKTIRDRPGMYIGETTPRNLETFFLGFDSAYDDVSYFQSLFESRPGPTLISDMESFEEAFEAVLEAAERAEREQGAANE